MCVYIHTYIQIYVYIFIHIYTYIDVLHTYIHVQYVYTYTICIYIYTLYICIYNMSKQKYMYSGNLNPLDLWWFRMQKLYIWIYLWRLVYMFCIKLLLDETYKQLLKQSWQHSGPQQLLQVGWGMPTVTRGPWHDLCFLGKLAQVSLQPLNHRIFNTGHLHPAWQCLFWQQSASL